MYRLYMYMSVLSSRSQNVLGTMPFVLYVTM
jgi:hypothetical protein